MKKLILSLLALLCLGCFAIAQNNPTAHALRVYDPNHAPTNPCNGTPCDINYNGGPVVETAPTVYIVWYGSWTKKDKAVIDYFFSNLSGTTMMKINTTYSDSSNKKVQNALKHNPATDDYHDNYSLGKNISDGTIQQIVANAIKNKHLPNDTNGIYFVLTYTDVHQSGFCSQFCGYHSPSTSIVSGEVIRYSMVGNPNQCPSGCSTPVVLHDTGKGGSPNQDPGADGATAIMWHEFSETVSDPEVNLHTAWVGNFCGESGDCCAWLFGTVKKDGNGNLYTNTVGKKNYVMQMMLELTSKSRTGNVPAECNNVYVKP